MTLILFETEGYNQKIEQLFPYPRASIVLFSKVNYLSRLVTKE